MIMSSMKDVARLAGVSISTVSRVINQNIPVDEQTRRKVEEAIRKLKYKPNLLAKGLRLKSGHLIGLVVPEIVPLHAFANIIKYTEESASLHDFNIILGNHHDDPDVEERFIDKLIRRNVDGIIFSRVSDESRVLKILYERDIPIVAIDRVLENENVPSVVIDNYSSGVMAAEHLVSLGHKHIACITGALNISLCRERIKGFSHVLRQHNIEFDSRMIFEGDFKLETGRRAMSFFLQNQPQVTGIWAHNDLMAAGAVKELLKRGIRVPGDISILGMDDISVARIITPELTTIKQPFKEMSEKAIELIIMQKNGQEIPCKKIVLKPSLVIRETTGLTR